ncbi:fungal pheromone mating factor STE2 GPCR-domain-containing protein [Xylariaceae sp. FL0016]|nr:fungal pheromone mating factor STE2 GPCR-domain-containing protein [Xylariaceae sp. FL0016]
MDSNPGPDFDPTTQTFFITARNGSSIPISMVNIEAQRVRLANVSINYGVQLGLCILALIVVLIFLPRYKMKKVINVVQISALVAAVIRLALLVLYFPGPLTGFYVIWTQDASILDDSKYYTNTTSNAFSVAQFALIEMALILQSWAMIRTWPHVWQLPTLFASIVLAAATVLIKSIWIFHHSYLVKGHTLPIPLDLVGKTAVVLGAASIFYFCGIFFAHISVHLVLTRSVLQRPDKGLTALEILAIGNAVLMLAPSLFAGLDIAAGPGNTKVLPFDAGSWVQTLVVSGMPLISLVAFYRGSDSRNRSRRVSLFAHGQLPDSKMDDSTLGDSSNPGGSFAAGNDVFALRPTPRTRARISDEEMGSEEGLRSERERAAEVHENTSISMKPDDRAVSPGTAHYA